ncbi:hypothetical protein [Mesorhizobium sp.]|uniref:hypothetical protein n=1 Tax=Mesorhizobium sp. TaxID=1871066 RepID=UPI00257D7D37|nr:hypothetical protein [Mesorhizobium sp.]
MAKAQSGAQVSVFDCDILRSAFIKTVIEENIPEDKLAIGCRAFDQRFYRER